MQLAQLPQPPQQYVVKVFRRRLGGLRRLGSVAQLGNLGGLRCPGCPGCPGRYGVLGGGLEAGRITPYEFAPCEFTPYGLASYEFAPTVPMRPSGRTGAEGVP